MRLDKFKLISHSNMFLFIEWVRMEAQPKYINNKWVIKNIQNSPYPEYTIEQLYEVYLKKIKADLKKIR